MNEPLLITLPVQPPVGTTVEIADGNNAGTRYHHDSQDVWIDIRSDRRRVDWSWIWWAVCEDGGGGTAVRVVDDLHPLPWRVTGQRDAYVEDSAGRIVCEIVSKHVLDPRSMAQRIVDAINVAGAES